MSLLRQLLIEEEGWRNTVYEDTLGVPTIGVGRNLRDRGLSDQEIDILLANDLREVQSQAAQIPGFVALNEVQKAVICSMIFQLGMQGLMRFKKMMAAIARGDVQEAAVEGMDSLWARQTPVRAGRQMQMLLTGQWVNCQEVRT